MMIKKKIPNPSLVRRVPKHFSWVDHRLVRLGYLRGRSPHALALYLLLVTVGDADGVSWYGDERISVELGISQRAVREVRTELQKAGLIAYDRPFYQVLSVSDEPVTLPKLEDAFERLANGRVSR
jgi:hypothetical protein